MIYTYVFGLLFVNSLLILWFYSPLPSSISKIFFKKNNVYTLDDFLDFVAVKNQTLSTLLSCWVCMSFWLSLMCGLILYLVLNVEFLFPLITFFTYPAILFLIKQLYR